MRRTATRSRTARATDAPTRAAARTAVVDWGPHPWRAQRLRAGTRRGEHYVCWTREESVDRVGGAARRHAHDGVSGVDGARLRAVRRADRGGRRLLAPRPARPWGLHGGRCGDGAGLPGVSTRPRGGDRRRVRGTRGRAGDGRPHDLLGPLSSPMRALILPLDRVHGPVALCTRPAGPRAVPGS